MTWNLQTDETLGKRIITYPADTPLPGEVVRLRASGKTLIVRGRARAPGTSGTVVRIASQRGIKAGEVKADALTKSGMVRYQFFWLFRSARGLLALGTVVFLIAGTALTGEVAIRTTVTGTVNSHLAGQAWAGLLLNIVGILAAAAKELFAG
jgi:hypothetical protein